MPFWELSSVKFHQFSYNIGKDDMITSLGIFFFVFNYKYYINKGNFFRDLLSDKKTI